MNLKKITVLLVLLMMAGYTKAQNTGYKKLDHKKWKELVKEVDSKRYDKAEPEPQGEYNLEEDPQQEYGNYEREIYGDDNYEGGSNGDGGGNGSGGGGYSSSNDDGVYDASTDDDKSFFDESNDRGGNGNGGTGNGGSGGDGDDVGSRYRDEQGSSGSEPSPKYERTERQPILFDKPEKAKAETREASKQGGDSTWLIIIMVVILAIAVVYMIVVAFSDKNKKVVPVVETPESKIENLTITKSELELALEAALANKNYREAVRIYFIAIIKEMKDRSWIKWEKKKTNYHYINEINGRQQQPDFITATRAFEIVWYGNRTLDEKDYYQIEPHFKKLLHSIHA